MHTIYLGGALELYTDERFLDKAGGGFHVVSSTPSGYWSYRSYSGYKSREAHEPGTELVVDGLKPRNRVKRIVTVRVTTNRRHGGTIFTEEWEAKDFCNRKNKSPQQGRMTTMSTNDFEAVDSLFANLQVDSVFYATTPGRDTYYVGTYVVTDTSSDEAPGVTANEVDERGNVIGTFDGFLDERFQQGLSLDADVVQERVNRLNSELEARTQVSVA